MKARASRSLASIAALNWLRIGFRRVWSNAGSYGEEASIAFRRASY